MKKNKITPTDDGFILRGVVREWPTMSDEPDVKCAPVSRISVAPAGEVEFIDDLLSDKTVSSNEETLGRIIALDNVSSGESYVRITEGDGQLTTVISDDIADSLGQGRKLFDSFKLQTSDRDFNLISRLAIPAYRAAWWNNNGTHIHLHGATAWPGPYIGWRVMYGASVLGWNDLISESILAHGEHQISDGAFSNIYTLDNYWGYNMDEVFVHQIFHYYNWTGDDELIRKMWPRIEKNIKFRTDKLDPDGDGLSTNRLNTWISDCHWYLGGQCTQSSSYNYDVYKNLAETAHLVGRNPAPFTAEAERIKKAMNDVLWLEDQGVYAESKDTIGLKRIHRSVEMPSVYHPIEIGIPGPERAARMAAFVRDNTEDIITPGDGIIPHSSPWRPTGPDNVHHSSRARCVNETLHMALGAYQAGLDDYANRIMRGVKYSVINSVTSPGSFCNWVDAQGRGERHPNFSDSTSLFFRAVAEGMFGIEPAVGKGRVRFTPRFPAKWGNASLSTAGFTVDFKRSGVSEKFAFKTEKPLEYEIRLPLRYESIDSVTVNGKASEYVLETPVALPRIKLNIPTGSSADVVVNYEAGSAVAKAVEVKAPSLESFLLPDGLPVVPEYDRSKCQTVLYDLDKYRNADLEKVFDQTYSSKEMERLHWTDISRNTLSRWDHTIPKPSLSKLRDMVDDKGEFVTEDAKTKFKVSTGDKNVVLLARWEQLPNEVSLPVGKKSVKEVCLLIAGTTFPMQSHIANARILLHYKDGESISTDLINPYNYDDTVGNFGYYHYSENEEVPLGEGTHADVIKLPANPQKELASVKLQCLSDQILFGVQAMTLYQQQ